MDISSLIKTTREGKRAKHSARAKSLTRSRGESPFTRSRAASLCARKTNQMSYSWEQQNSGLISSQKFLTCLSMN